MNKKLVITFLILAIIPYFSFIVVRNIEEHESSDTGYEQFFLSNNTIDLTPSKEKSKNNSMDDIIKKMQQDKFYKRKSEINTEVKKMSVPARYIGLYIYLIILQNSY